MLHCVIPTRKNFNIDITWFLWNNLSIIGESTGRTTHTAYEIGGFEVRALARALISL